MGNRSSKNEPRPPGEVDLRDFKLRQVIGKGAFGKVKLVEFRTTKQKYALKYINKLQCIEKKQIYHMFDERMLLESLEHPFIVNLRFAFQDDENMFMVLDVALGGDLRYHLLRLGSFPEDTLKIYAAEVGLALQYLHGLRIMHRDLKPDNLLLDENGHIYVTDFNIAHQIKNKLPTAQSGSMAYMAPEMFLKKGYDVFVDYWALGVVLYECTYGYRPFKESESKTLVESIMYSEPKFRTGPPEHLVQINAMKLKRGKKEKPGTVWVESENRTSFLKALLVKDVDKRLGSGKDGFENFTKHIWFEGLDWDLAKQKKLTPSFVPDPNNANFEATHEIEEVIMNDTKTLQYKPRKRKKDKNTETASKAKSKKPVDPQQAEIEAALDYIDEHYTTYNKEFGIGRITSDALSAAPDKAAAIASTSSSSGLPIGDQESGPTPELRPSTNSAISNANSVSGPNYVAGTAAPALDSSDTSVVPRTSAKLPSEVSGEAAAAPMPAVAEVPSEATAEQHPISA